MHTTNTVFTRCRRLYDAGGSVLANMPGATHGVDDCVKEFQIAKINYEWQPAAAGAFRPDWMPPFPSALAPYLFTYCAINGQNGEQTWYGFGSWDQLLFFRTLLQADKVGPKTAFKILAQTPWSQIKAILAAGDREAFVKLKGVGEKGGRVLVELLFTKAPTKAPARANKEAELALVALGCKASDAKQRVAAAIAAQPEASTEDIVKLALQNKT